MKVKKKKKFLMQEKLSMQTLNKAKKEKMKKSKIIINMNKKKIMQK